MIQNELFFNDENDSDFRVLNLLDTSSSGVTIKPDTIPTLVTASAEKEIMEDDKEPFYKIQRMEYPIVGNRIEYTESFFESFLNKLKNSPIPGSKSGHTSFFSSERPDTDFYLVGGKLEKNGDGTGVVYFKNYIPKEGATSSNSRFITENKANMVHFSLVTCPKLIVENDPETGDVKRTAVESVRGERNDAVELNMGAMKQETNAGKSGVENSEKGEKSMEIKEMLVAIKNALKNGSVAVGDVAKGLEIEDKMVNSRHEEAAKVMKGLADLGVKDKIVEEVAALQNKVKADSDLVYNAKLDTEFGASKKDAAGAETNVLRECAEMALKNADRAKVDEAIVAFKNSAVAKTLAGQLASTQSAVNVVQSAPAVNAVGGSAGINSKEY